MFYNKDDEFFKLLGDKISQVTPKQPTNGDWASFDKAYRAHKQGNKKRKMSFLILISILTVSLFSVYAIYLNKITNEQLSIVRPTDNKEIIKDEVSIAPFINLEKPILTTSEIANNKTRLLPNNKEDGNEVAKQIIQKNKIENKNRNAVNVTNQNILIETKGRIELIKNRSDLILLTSKSYLLNLSQPQLIRIENRNALRTKIYSIDIDSAKNKTLKTKGKLMVNLAFVELGYLLQSNAYKQLNNSSSQYFNGIGVNAGFNMSKNWSLNFGLSALFFNQIEMNKRAFVTTEKHIESIDTTIKYNAFYKRLMMQIDTVTSEKNVEHHANSSYQNYIAFYNLPIQLRYQLGNEKRGVYGALGITGTVIYQQETNVNNIGLFNETIQTNNNYQMLFAPTMGVGGYQKLYHNWALHISANYLKYLNGSFHQPNNIQIQTGLKYNF
jgi:hypothetical protein